MMRDRLLRRSFLPCSTVSLVLHYSVCFPISTGAATCTSPMHAHPPPQRAPMQGAGSGPMGGGGSVLPWIERSAHEA
jgi:hypothetical protein